MADTKEIYITGGILLVTMIGGFWSLADPRNDIRDIKTSYLTLREFEGFVRRFETDVTRVETASRQQISDVAKKADLDAVKDANALTASNLEKRLDLQQRTIDLLLERSLQKSQ
jgi:hypothetical protein